MAAPVTRFDRMTQKEWDSLPFKVAMAIFDESQKQKDAAEVAAYTVQNRGWRAKADELLEVWDKARRAQMSTTERKKEDDAIDAIIKLQTAECLSFVHL